MVLFNLGGPDSLQAVKPFLFNLFSDPDIFKIPAGQGWFAKMLSTWRAPSVRHKYKRIGGKSPINEWTEVQRSMLQKKLEAAVSDAEVFIAMRYWNPAIREVAEKLSDSIHEKIVLLPLYPHYSITTTGSAFNEWNRFYTGDATRLIHINDYFNHPHYIFALNERIAESILLFPENLRSDIQIVFSAHGMPERIVQKGDPYAKQIEETVKKVMAVRNFSHKHHLCYQSKVGPGKWLEPSTEKMIARLATKNKKQLLIVPISFVSDHIETLFELDIEYRTLADTLGIEHYIVMQGLNDSETFVAALAEIAVQALTEEDPLTRKGRDTEPPSLFK